ncbi:MAG: Ig-like domain-containing protein [Actinomycetota bacterium]
MGGLGRGVRGSARVLVAVLALLAVGGGVAGAMTARQFAATVGTPQKATGVVAGSVAPSSPPSTPLTYTVPANPGSGSVTVSPDGAFTYTPTASARHAAAAPNAPTTDSFTITVTDGYGGTTDVPVTVPIASANKPPVVTAKRVAAVAPATGVVTGSVTAIDPDGDPLTFAPTARSTPKGAVAVNSATGAFTYTPTAAARVNSASATTSTSPARSGTFVVKVTDGYGGVVRVPVRVPIR